MSDINTQLPIRTDNPGDVIVKIADATTPSQQLLVNADGSINVNASATNLDIRDLSAAQDNVAISDGTDKLAVNTDGSLNITDNGGSLTVDATNLDIRDLAFATDKVDVSGSSVTVSGTVSVSGTVDVSGSSVTVSATDLDIRNLSASQDNVAISDGTDTLAINADGSLNVAIVGGGTAVNEFQTNSAVAVDSSVTHTYTAIGAFKLTQIKATSSGKMKLEVKANGVTKFVEFGTAAYPNLDITLSSPLTIAAAQTIEVVLTNKDINPQNLYSTISGIEP